MYNTLYYSKHVDVLGDFVLTNAIGFSSGKLILRKVCIHFVSIKVSIVALAVSIMKTKGLLTWENSGLLSEQISLASCSHYKTKFKCIIIASHCKQE